MTKGEADEDAGAEAGPDAMAAPQKLKKQKK